MEPLGIGDVPLIHPHQHGRRLLTGGGVGGQELQGAVGPLHAVDHADVVGDGHIARVLLHIVKGQLQPGQVLGQGIVSQGPHQHNGHLAPADVVLRPEGPAGVHHIVGTGGLHGGVVPGGGGAVNVSRAGGGHHVPAEHAAQHGDKLAAGNLIPNAEGAVGIALHKAVVLRLFHHLLGPVALSIGKCRPGGERGGREHQQSGQRPGADSFQHKLRPPCICGKKNGYRHLHCTKIPAKVQSESASRAGPAGPRQKNHLIFPQNF